jgi:hypothetical protein
MGNTLSCYESGEWDSHTHISRAYTPAMTAVYQDMTQPLRCAAHEGRLGPAARSHPATVPSPLQLVFQQPASAAAASTPTPDTL